MTEALIAAARRGAARRGAARCGAVNGDVACLTVPSCKGLKMKLYTPSRRAFLAGLTAVLALAAALLRGLLGRRNPLVGDWRIQDYICDGKPVMNGIDVTVSITPKTVSARIRMRGHPDHIDVHNYSIRRSTQEIDMDASNGGMFLGVYSELPQGLILAWDTVGRHRPRSVDEPARFGLNRLVLTRDDSHTLSSA